MALLSGGHDWADALRQVLVGSGLQPSCLPAPGGMPGPSSVGSPRGLTVPHFVGPLAPRAVDSEYYKETYEVEGQDASQTIWSSEWKLPDCSWILTIR